MFDLLFLALCIGGAFLVLVFGWAAVEILLGSGSAGQKHDPTLNAFQQPLSRQPRDD